MVGSAITRNLENKGETVLKVSRADQPDRHRQEEVVEQHRPTSDKPEVIADAVAHIAIGRPGYRKDFLNFRRPFPLSGFAGEGLGVRL